MSVLRGAEILNKLRKKITDSSYSSYDELNEAQRWIGVQTNFTWLRQRSTAAVAAISGTSKYSLNLANVRSFSALWIAPSKTENSVSISAITLSGTDPVAITTSAAHGLTTADKGTFANVGGTTELNGNTYTLTVTGTTTFTLDGTNSALFSAWTSGGDFSAWSVDNTNWKLMEEAPAQVFEEKVKNNDDSNLTNTTSKYESHNWYYYLEGGSIAPIYTLYITPTPDSTMMVRVDYTKRLTDIDEDNFADIPPEYYDALINIAAGYILERSEEERKIILGKGYISRGQGYFNPLVNDTQRNRTANIDRPSQPWIQ